MKDITAIDNLKKMPRASLGFFPTPFYKLERMSEELGIELYIKRDDFTGANLFGGNKIRKLEFILGDALDKGCKSAITYGATQSNHAMETVMSCRRCGIDPVLFLTAVVKPDENDIRSNLLLDRIAGAEIHIVDIEEGESEADAEERSFILGHEYAESLDEQGKKCCEIPMGGASWIGSAGFANGFIELTEQMEAHGVDAEYIYHSTGTGGTLAGLAAGRAVAGSDIKIVSVSCSMKDEVYIKKTAALANEVLENIGSERRVEYGDICVDTGYFAPGYEQPNEMATEAIKLLARKEGLFVDPVYTGKAFAGLIDHVRKGKIPQGSKVVFWHTGGATALFAEKEITGSLA